MKTKKQEKEELIVKNNKVVGGIQGSAYAEDVEEAFTNAGLSK